MLARRDRAEGKKPARQIATIEAELAMPPFPAALAYIWRAFLRLRQRSAPGFNGAAPIGWQDIDSFIRRSGVRLTPWEIEIIEALDDLFLGVATEKKPDPSSPNAVETASMDDPAAVKALMRRGQPKKKKGG